MQYNTSADQIQVDNDQIDCSQWSQAALKFCLKRGLNEEDSKELIQDSYLTFLSAQTNFEGRSKLSTYLYGILLNKLSEHYRRNSLKTRHYLKTTSALEPTSTSHPEQELMGKELLHCLNQSINKLPRVAKSVFLHTLEPNYSSSAAAKRSGLSKNNLGVIIHRCKRALQDDLIALH